MPILAGIIKTCSLGQSLPKNDTIPVRYASSCFRCSRGRIAGKIDVVIKNGTVYDGTGSEGRKADVAIRGDRIVGVGDFQNSSATNVIDAHDLAVAPGFINMLSWSTESLIQDGRSQSEIRQGVTTEIMGEGESMGPVNDRVRQYM